LLSIGTPAAPTSYYHDFQKIDHLTAHLGLSSDQLRGLSDKAQRRESYKIGSVTLRGKVRTLAIPIDQSLKNTHGRLLQFLRQYESTIPLSVHGYVRGRSAFTNAQSHVDWLNENGVEPTGRHILRVDIQDFFPSITAEMVRRSMEVVLGMGAEVCALLASLVTFEGSLPLGPSTSPLISNLVMWRVDQDVEEWARRRSWHYTRYADDMTFSASSPLNPEGLDRIIAEHGFRLNERKTRRAKHGQYLFTTGLSLSDGGHARLPKAYKKSLRRDAHFLQKFGIEDQAEMFDATENYQWQRFRGRLLYAHSVEPEYVERLRARYPIVGEAFRSHGGVSDASRARESRLIELFAQIVSREEPKAPSYQP
jgi:Reverse transcriptase (RNA-dependent DNA polymerase)